MINMQKFIMKKGTCPQRIGALLHLEIGSPCILVYDNTTCVGVVWEHQENRDSLANGQAEIRFFDNFKNSYGLWHRMFNGQRIMYSYLELQLEKNNEYIYWGKFRER